MRLSNKRSIHDNFALHARLYELDEAMKNLHLDVTGRDWDIGPDRICDYAIMWNGLRMMLRTGNVSHAPN